MSRVIPIIDSSKWQGEICARCVSPGHCCTGFNLSDAEGNPRVVWDDETPELPDGYPFKPLERWGQWTVESGPEAGRTYSAWLYACSKLSADGKCTIYDERPDLCRQYEPLTDHLCIMKKQTPEPAPA